MQKNPQIYSKPDFVKGLSDSSRHTADMAVIAIGDSQSLFDEVFDIAIHSKYPMCMRAARVIQLYCQRNSNFLVPYLDNMTNIIRNHRVDGVKRNFLKIIFDVVDIEQFSDVGPITELCFGYIQDTKQSPAVRVLAMQVAFKTSMLYPELQYELRELLSVEINSPHQCLRQKSKELLKKIYI